jgi:hypothetical protein
MTAQDTTVFGWTYEQWVKAIDYQNQCEPAVFDAPTTPNAFVEALKGAINALKYLAEVQRFWRMRRLDQPLEVRLILP